MKPFWETKTLKQMSKAEWESLCDGCGKCCIVLLDEEETGVLYETNIACQLFDPETRRCSDYKNRAKRVPDCVQLTPDCIEKLQWMPKSCAYRRLAKGEGLPKWHPLVTGDPKSTARAGKAVKKSLVREQDVDEEDVWDHVTGKRK